MVLFTVFYMPSTQLLNKSLDICGGFSLNDSHIKQKCMLAADISSAQVLAQNKPDTCAADPLYKLQIKTLVSQFCCIDLGQQCLHS